MALKRGMLMRFVMMTLIVMPVVSGIASEGGGWTQEKEKILFQEIPMVVTASLKEQPLTEAPTTISVITSEDIKYSGATNIPDVLRMVAGVDVMTISDRDQQVGVRGFIAPINNKLLVLIDGRSVYTDFYGDVSWDLFPIGLEEIDRIEVVKSPASSIYGANAYSGVIHILTKSPEQLQGTTLKLTAGSQNTLIGSILHAGVLRRKTIRYKISTQLDRTSAWGENESEENAGDITRVNARVEYVPDEKTKLFLSGGRAHSQEQKLFTFGRGGTSKSRDTIDYLQAGIKVGHLQLRVFFKSERRELERLLSGDHVSWMAGTYDAELLHSFRIGANHSLVWGINYRLNTLEKNLLVPQDHQQHLWSLFLEDEVKLSDKLRLTLGGRYDRHPLVGDHFSPREGLFGDRPIFHYWGKSLRGYRVVKRKTSSKKFREKVATMNEWCKRHRHFSIGFLINCLGKMAGIPLEKIAALKQDKKDLLKKRLFDLDPGERSILLLDLCQLKRAKIYILRNPGISGKSLNGFVKKLLLLKESGVLILCLAEIFMRPDKSYKYEFDLASKRYEDLYNYGKSINFLGNLSGSY